MATLISHSPAETEALGEAWGREAESGWVLGLCGELGAGKTQLVRGLARGLGCSDRVHSPTFTLVNIYGGGRLRLFHIDLYRLETREQIIAAGLEEYLNPAGIAVIEWAERWFGTELPRSPVGGRNGLEQIATAGSRNQLRWVQMDSLNENERHIVYEDTLA
jgi:tRNA threonylcarbamoyladenosine biosynthesis protein TsaE